MYLNRFRGVKKLVSESDFLNADKFLHHARVCSICDYSKRDFLYRSGRWREVETPVKLFERKSESERTLLIGHSDKDTHLAHIVPYLLKGYKNFWAINAVPFRSILKPLPLGLTNPTSESRIHTIFGATSHLDAADSESDFPTYFDGSIYGNFSIDTNIQIRRPLAEFLKKQGSVLIEPKFTECGRIEYLSALRRNSLVVCPEGNGVDTHRLWETLYMGGTPVITHSNQLSRLVEDLPVLILKDWTELKNMGLLEEMWNQLNDKSFNFDKLKASYWVSQFCNKS